MRSRRLLVATGIYGLGLVLVGLWSSPIDRNISVTELIPVVWLRNWFDLDIPQAYHLVEFTANVVLFVPLGVLLLLWLPRWSWLAATGVSLAVSAAIEVLQQVLRPERFATIDDVVANTAGGAIGALLVVGVRVLRR